MTIVTARGGVFAGERKARLAVVHGFAVGLPTNQRKVRPIVFGVATHAVLAGRVRRQPHGVHPLRLRYALPDLCVTIETLKLNSPAAKFVTFRAAQRTGKRLVCFGQRPGEICAAAGTATHSHSRISAK